MKKWDLYLGTLISVYIILINILFGKVSFSLPILIIGIILINFHFIKEKLYLNPKMMKNFKWVKILLFIGIIIFVSILSTIYFYPKKDTSQVDYAIILGAGINGEKLSLTLKQRLDKAIYYFNNYDNECIIVLSGGQGSDEDISEAEAMKRYLVENNINEERILKEDKSTNTFENFKFSKAIIENHTKKEVKNLDIKIITSDFHGFRSTLLAKRNGYKNTTLYTNKTFIPIIPVTYAREVFAVVKSIIFDN